MVSVDVGSSQDILIYMSLEFLIPDIGSYFRAKND